VLTAAEDDQLGSYAPAAMAQLTAAAATAAAACKAAKRGAAALEVSSTEHILLTSRCTRCRCLVNVCPPRSLKVTVLLLLLLLVCGCHLRTMYLLTAALNAVIILVVLVN
jgi:hypothetical protein